MKLLKGAIALGLQGRRGVFEEFSLVLCGSFELFAESSIDVLGFAAELASVAFLDSELSAVAGLQHR